MNLYRNRRTKKKEINFKNKEIDIGSGKYGLGKIDKDTSQNILSSYYLIKRIADIDPKDVAGKYKVDLAHWSISIVNSSAQFDKVIQRFF